ncbi:MAG: hypothetical protein ACK42H_07100 [Planctomycetota bacterium]|jgi:hypothetical protein
MTTKTRPATREEKIVRPGVYEVPAPPRREWAGLTGKELDLIARTAADLYDAALKSEAKLKEKNAWT